MLKLGISTYALPWSFGIPGVTDAPAVLSPLDLLDLARRYHLRIVQFGDNVPYALLAQNASLIRDRAVDAGVQLELATTGTRAEQVQPYIELCGAIGAKRIRTLVTTTEFDEAVRQLQDVTPLLAASQVHLMIENHGLHPMIWLVDLVRSLGSSMVSLCVDTANSLEVPETFHDIASVSKPYCTSGHLKDYNIRRSSDKMSVIVTGAPLGDGMLDIMSVIRFFGDADVSFILEQWVPWALTLERTRENERQRLVQSITFLSQHCNAWFGTLI